MGNYRALRDKEMASVIFKKGKKAGPVTYRRLSLMLPLGQNLEQCLRRWFSSSHRGHQPLTHVVSVLSPPFPARTSDGKRVNEVADGPQSGKEGMRKETDLTDCF